jgi:hypothetical protein
MTATATDPHGTADACGRAGGLAPTCVMTLDLQSEERVGHEEDHSLSDVRQIKDQVIAKQGAK